MKKIFTFFIISFLFISEFSLAQVYINELDSDSPGIDTKEFVEIRTTNPFTSLNGYVLVFFNGNPSSSLAFLSYYTINLSSLTTDANGIATIGNADVSPVPDMILSDNIIQNGEDAIAIYQGLASNYPDGTMATSTNLVHALAYDTADPDAVAIMALLGITSPQMDENENTTLQTESIQRKNNGDFEVKAPTPGAMNDGSGVQYNGITINANLAHKTETDTMHIIFTTQTAVTTPLTFTFSMNYGSFNSSDYSGITTVNFAIGASSATSIMTLTDDILNEGDEELKIKFGTIPVGYNRLNDNIIIRVIDNDYTIDPWGTPLQPTYGVVTSTAPVGYYSSLNGLSGAQLKQALQNIIADSNIVRAHNYGDMTDILKEADHNPKNGNQVWLMYVETPRAKLDFQNTGSGTGKWNREHIYPQSRGGYSSGTSDTPDGINIYLPTNANNILAGHADAHHIRAEDAVENSTRNNKDYGQDYNGPNGNQQSWKGDVARAIFYMCVRYNGLSVVPGNPADSSVGVFGDLDSLNIWSLIDPRDDFEMNRNNYIYTWQKNRNPFIDLPDLASYIFGVNVGQVFNLGVATKDIELKKVVIYPNPTTNQLRIYGITSKANIELYDLMGKLIFSKTIDENEVIPINFPQGIYTLKIKMDEAITVKKLLIR